MIFRHTAIAGAWRFGLIASLAGCAPTYSSVLLPDGRPAFAVHTYSYAKTEEALREVVLENLPPCQPEKAVFHVFDREPWRSTGGLPMQKVFAVVTCDGSRPVKD